MKQKKKILALALTCAMLVSCVSTGFATDASAGNETQNPPVVMTTALTDNFGLIKGETEIASKTIALSNFVTKLDDAVYTVEGSVKGEDPSIGEIQTDKPSVYVEITKDAYKAGEAIEFAVKYANMPEGESIGAVSGEIVAPEGITFTACTPGTGLAANDAALVDGKVVLNFANASAPLTAAAGTLATITGTMDAEISDYKSIELTSTIVTNVDFKKYRQSDGSLYTYKDSFGTQIPETKNIDDLTFNFVGASNNTLGYGTDYTVKVNNKELSYDEVQAELAKVKTNADLNAFLNGASVVFKTEGKFDVSVTYAGETAVTEGMTETVKPKPATDPALENLKSSYSVSVQKASTRVVQLAVLFGSEAGSSKDMYTALKNLNGETQVNVTKVLTGSGMSSVNIDDVSASSNRVVTLLKNCKTVKELIDAINSVDFKMGSSSTSTFKFEATIGGKAVTLATDYKNTSGSNGNGNSSNGNSSSDDKNNTVLMPNFTSGGILTKANNSALNGKTITPLMATSDKFMINVAGVTNMTGFDPLLAKVPYTLGAKNANDIVVVDKNNKVVGRSAYLDNGYVGVALKTAGTNNGYTITTMRQNFDDTNIDWANDAISALAVRGIIKGVDGTNNNFEPNRAITRAEFIKLVVAMFDVADPNARAQFTDIADTDWYSSVIGTAQNMGITNGYEDGSFNPNATITRQEMCTMLSRAAAVLGVNLKNVNAMTTYDDDAQIGDWAKDSVYTMQMANVMKGVGYNQFQPASNTTRAQAAVAIYNMLKASLDF